MPYMSGRVYIDDDTALASLFPLESGDCFLYQGFVLGEHPVFRQAYPDGADVPPRVQPGYGAVWSDCAEAVSP